MDLDTRGKQIFAAVWAILEILIFGGLLFGWGSLVYILKKESVYAELCDNKHDILVGNTSLIDNSSLSPLYHNGTYFTRDKNNTVSTNCVEQDKVFNLGFAITTALFTYGNLAASQINYKCGTRLTRLIFIGMFVVGALMLAFVSKDIPWLVFPGMLFVGIAGITLFFTNVQVAYLFSRGRSVLVALLSGALDTSVLTQLCVKFAYEGGISILASYIFIAVAVCVTLISTFIWLPKQFLETQEKEGTECKDELELKTLKEKEHLSDDMEIATENGNMVSTKENDASSSLKKKGHQKNICSYIFSSTYIFHVVWFSILQLRFYFYIGSLNRWLVTISQDDQEVSYLTNVSIYAMLGGIPASFIAGSLYDCEKRRHRKKTMTRRSLAPPILPLTTATVFGIALSSLQLIHNIAATYAVFVVLTFFRAFLYSIAGGYLSNLFPSSHFGILFGIMMSSGGTVGFLQYALFSWVEAYSNATNHVNIFLICLVAVTFIHPIHLWVKCRKTGRKEISSDLAETS